MTAATIPARRAGPGHWLQAFGHLTRWQVTRLRRLLPMTMVVQVLSTTGIVVGMGLLYGDMPDERVLYLTTGAVTISLITVGLVMGPQILAQERISGSAEYMQSLPVPRSAATMGWMVLNLATIVPGIISALLAAALWYDVDLSVSWRVLPAVGIVTFAATMVGVAYAYAIPNPRTVNAVAQLLVFAVFGFSPIAYPADQLPDWLAGIHRWLPFESMAVVIRDSLTDGLATDVGRSYVVLGIWTVAAVALATLSLGRRG